MSKSTSDTDTSSSDSSRELERKRKLLKKMKKKSEKKSKKHKKEKKKKSRKEKKRSRKESSSSSSCSEEDNVQIAKVQTKPIITVIQNDNNEVIDDAFGPALPPHLLNKNQLSSKEENKVIGPVIPQELMGKLQENIPENSPIEEEIDEKEEEEECLQGSYGPLPVTNPTEMTAAQIELEKRALELKMAAIDGINAPTTDTTVREEWMLELPEVGLKGGLAALSNMKRGFHQGKEKPDFSDRYF